ncbi:hypothetical protein BKA59DRAFT_525338 [Fusarium tricinctum]|uniref:Uncharacterized protein n=1 Tax=Fusarium tricinctum TaxID=61284 RepID=A0A8K0S2E1_9HYPO|nr:hypothetical protein BKA59DRAFT_525338 [Fusarium tricinctum]
MEFCNGGLRCSTPADNVVDADMNGIGVVLSFVITAAISVIVAIMAVIKRAIPKQQYLRLDEKVLYWIGVRRPASDSPSNLGYQSLLLALSDQMLAVGLCYLIAMYAQVCRVSLYSFFIGAQLGYLSSTVHLCTLLVLKSYFRKHPKQALLRSGLMVLFLGLLMSALMLEFITLSEPRDRLFLCGLHQPILPRVKTIGIRCFSISVMLAFVYWNAFRSIKLDSSLRYEQGHSVSRNAILRRIFSSEKGRADLQTFLEKDEEERRRRTQKNVAIMERRPGFWKAFSIITVPIIGLFYQGVDTKPLLMTSFGQIMPMLLLLVIALTAVEIGTIKNFRGIEIEIEVKKHPVSMPNTARRVPALEGYAPSSSQEMTSELSQSRTGIVDERSFNDSTSVYGNPLLPLAAASYSQPDLTGNPGFGTRVDSMTRWMTPRRANTMELEEGKKPLFPSQQPAMDSLDIGLQNAKGTTYIVIAVVLCLLAGFFVACFFFYQIVVPIVSGTLIFGLTLNVALGVRGVSKAKRERNQRGRQI